MRRTLKKYFKQYPAVFGNRIGLNIVTVCTIKDGHKYGRGVSVCSSEDIPNDRDGREYAERAALHAVKGRKEILITDQRAIRALLKTDCPFIYHSQAWPLLTWQEKRFFFGKNFLKDAIGIDYRIDLQKLATSIREAKGLLNSFNASKGIK